MKDNDFFPHSSSMKYYIFLDREERNLTQTNGIIYLVQANTTHYEIILFGRNIA